MPLQAMRSWSQLQPVARSFSLDSSPLEYSAKIYVIRWILLLLIIKNVLLVAFHIKGHILMQKLEMMGQGWTGVPVCGPAAADSENLSARCSNLNPDPVKHLTLCGTAEQMTAPPGLQRDADFS